MLSRYDPVDTLLAWPIEQRKLPDGQTPRHVTAQKFLNQCKYRWALQFGEEVPELLGFHGTFRESTFPWHFTAIAGESPTALRSPSQNRRILPLDTLSGVWRISNLRSKNSSETGVVEMVEHQVDEHAGHRNIEPDRKGPPGPASMLKTTIAQA